MILSRLSMYTKSRRSDPRDAEYSGNICGSRLRGAVAQLPTETFDL